MLGLSGSGLHGLNNRWRLTLSRNLKLHRKYASVFMLTEMSLPVSGYVDLETP
jgi:hypothetical protein